MNDDNIYEFNIQSELDLNIAETIKRYGKGIKNSENQLNILLKKKSRTDENLRSFIKQAQESKNKIELVVIKDKIIITKETKHE
jgi:hypothetical protein